MRSGRAIARTMTWVAIIVIVSTALASWYLQTPEPLVAGAGIAVFVGTVASLWLTEPLVESSNALVKAYDNLRYLENKRDSVEEARKRHSAWTALSAWGQSGGDVPEFLAQGSFLVGDPWLPDYRKICEYLQGFNPGLPSGAAEDFTNNKARERKVQFERVLEDLQRRPGSSFSETEDLGDLDAYMKRRKMFPYNQ